MISTKKISKDNMSMYKLILFKIFTLGFTKDNSFGPMYSIFFGILTYEIHIQLRKWELKMPIINTGKKSDA